MSFGVYIHWPYCTRICPYCDFNVYKNRDVDEAAWRNALVADLDWFADRTGRKALASIYFGGGTPSLMPPDLTADIIAHCKSLWPSGAETEVTLEANPTDAEQSRFRDFRSAGVTRLSLGVQSLRDGALRFLGRNHDAAAARRALDLALQLFDRTTIDLIYARPEQSLQAWQQELTEALSTGVRHLSLYQLTVEPGTAFQKAADRKDWALPDDPAQADFFKLTQEICEASGLPAYEISNHAVPGDESRHNLIYWRYGEYAGVGPGAHSRMEVDGKYHAIEAVRNPDAYLAKSPGEKFSFDEISPEDQAAEYLLMGLRLREGVRLSRYARLGGKELPTAALRDLSEDGLVDLEDGRLKLTTAGRPLLNRIALDLLA